ncbi:MAG: hypothetical protein HFI57_01525 [Lachnospiraceae bacterium]|nr:hypothetical protein [Lachnospiraceae bacterium]
MRIWQAEICLEKKIRSYSRSRQRDWYLRRFPAAGRFSKGKARREEKVERQDNDFKYFMQDTGSLYLGARFSYAEIMEQEMVSFKYKSIVEHYILKDTAPETTLESQLYYMTPDQFSYKTYIQLKAKVKVCVMVQKKSLFGKEKTGYENKVMKLDELVQMNLAQKKKCGMIIQELILSKLALMGFNV